MKQSHEFVLFKFNKETTKQEQLLLMKKISQCAEKLSGFISRSFYFSEEKGKWIDHVVWENESHALNASKKIMEDPEALEVFSKIDEASLEMGHYINEG